MAGKRPTAKPASRKTKAAKTEPNPIPVEAGSDEAEDEYLAALAETKARLRVVENRIGKAKLKGLRDQATRAEAQRKLILAQLECDRQRLERLTVREFGNRLQADDDRHETAQGAADGITRSSGAPSLPMRRDSEPN